MVHAICRCVFVCCSEQFISSTESNEVPQSIDKIISTFICVKSKPQCACISVRNSYHSQTLHDRNFLLKKFMFYVCVRAFFALALLNRTPKCDLLETSCTQDFIVGSPKSFTQLYIRTSSGQVSKQFFLFYFSLFALSCLVTNRVRVALHQVCCCWCCCALGIFHKPKECNLIFCSSIESVIVLLVFEPLSVHCVQCVRLQCAAYSKKRCQQ